MGLYLVCILGEYQGGSLRVPEANISTDAGAHGVAVWIDGPKIHTSDPFVGERYSIVAFEHGGSAGLPERGARGLEA